MHSVLITGGAGFIGQNLVHAWRAARASDRLVVIDAMTYAANIRSLEPLIARDEIAFVKGDIGDATLMQGLFDEHRFAFCLGSQTDPVRSWMRKCGSTIPVCLVYPARALPSGWRRSMQSLLLVKTGRESDSA